jgi:hypothetical protein
LHEGRYEPRDDEHEPRQPVHPRTLPAIGRCTAPGTRKGRVGGLARLVTLRDVAQVGRERTGLCRCRACSSSIWRNRNGQSAGRRRSLRRRVRSGANHP